MKRAKVNFVVYQISILVILKKLRIIKSISFQISKDWKKFSQDIKYFLALLRYVI